MKLRNLIKVAFKSILKNRMRSLLTMLGIIIGVASVIGMISVGEGAQSSVEGRISSLGTNVVMILPSANRFGGVSYGAASYNTLTVSDLRRIEKSAEFIQYITPLVNEREQVVAGRNNWYTSIVGVAPHYLEIRAWKLESGSFLNDRDVKTGKKVAILGKTVADQLFPSQDPVGESIRIRNVPFTVIGVMREKGQGATGSDSDDVILAPWTTVMNRLDDGKTINLMMASAISTDKMDDAQAEVRQILREEHQLKPGEEDDFTIRSQTEITEMASSVTKTFTLLLSAIASVSLLVGGIGIMNIMLVSVTERTREIGIRLAVGARSGDVLVQFLIEAVVLCLLGGVIGIIGGIGIGYGFCTFLKMEMALNPMIILVSFIFSGVVGVFFGFYPARKAANLDPIEALRYE